MDTVALNSGIATTVADSDLVAVADSGGALKPVSFANLMAAVNEKQGRSKNTYISLTGNEWVRVAKTSVLNITFLGILSVTHSWSSGKPTPLVCLINGASINADGFHAEQLTKDSFYAPSSTNNQSLSFTALRFVKESDAIYAEVRFKQNSSTNVICCTLTGQLNCLLVEASVSTASADKVLKTIDFSRGGVIVRYSNTYNSAKKGGPHADGGAERCAEGGADGYVSFGSLDSLAQFIGRAFDNRGFSDRFSKIWQSGLKQYPRLEDNRFEQHQYLQFPDSVQRPVVHLHKNKHHYLSVGDERRRRRSAILPSLFKQLLEPLEGNLNDHCDYLAGKEVAYADR